MSPIDQIRRKDTSFAALSQQKDNSSAKIKRQFSKVSNGGQDTAQEGAKVPSQRYEEDFGLDDMDDFLNEKSELFTYYKNKAYRVEPYQLGSVEEAIEDHDERERQFQNLVYSAANLNRPVPACNVCKLDHVPLQKDLLAERSAKKEAKKDMKKLAIKNQLIKNIENQEKRQKGTFKTLPECIEREQEYKAREARARRKVLRKDNYDIRVLLEESSDEDNTIDVEKLDTQEIEAIRL